MLAGVVNNTHAEGYVLSFCHIRLAGLKWHCYLNLFHYSLITCCAPLEWTCSRLLTEIHFWCSIGEIFTSSFLVSLHTLIWPSRNDWALKTNYLSIYLCSLYKCYTKITTHHCCHKQDRLLRCTRTRAVHSICSESQPCLQYSRADLLCLRNRGLVARESSKGVAFQKPVLGEWVGCRNHFWLCASWVLPILEL